jgi:hypothetical protein
VSATRRASALTPKVMMNNTRPVAINRFTSRPDDSGNWSAMFAAIVFEFEFVMMFQKYPSAGDRMMATAIVSPSARPRPSIAPEITPERPYGSTAWRIISQRVAPRASEASSCSLGVCRKTSREIAVMIGSTITASTMPTVSVERPLVDSREEINEIPERLRQPLRRVMADVQGNSNSDRRRKQQGDRGDVDRSENQRADVSQERIATTLEVGLVTCRKDRQPFLDEEEGNGTKGHQNQ